MLGSKYVDLHKGRSPDVIADGGTLPISQTHVPVQFDEIFQTFDPLTRRAIQDNLVGIGNTLAGRGSALNDTSRACRRCSATSSRSRATCRIRAHG